VPQAHAPPFSFEALEVVLMGRTARFGAFGRRDARTGLLPCTHCGNAASVISRTLAQETTLILMDEPTARLDFGNQAQLLVQITNVVRDAAETGRGIILAGHDPEQAFALGARVLLMKGGRTQAHGVAGDVLMDTNLSHVCGIPITVETTGSGRKVCLPSLGPQSAPTMTSEALTIA
jgi:iron complex transport system ATP-binding protein